MARSWRDGSMAAGGVQVVCRWCAHSHASAQRRAMMLLFRLRR